MLLAGCSVLSVRDAHTTPTKAIVCESSWVAPVIDTALAVAGAALMAWSATDDNTGEGDGHSLTNREVAIYPGFALALPFGFSAAHGYSKVASCKRAERPPPAFESNTVESKTVESNTVESNTTGSNTMAEK